MEETASSIAQDAIRPPAEAYDLAASHYDAWHWQEFWRRTETPFFDDCAESHDFEVRTRMLDVGCGTGYYLDRYGLLFRESYGIDPSTGMLSEASVRCDEAHLSVGGLDDLPYSDGAFDLVVCARVLSHVADLTTALNELVRVVAPGGLLLISNIDAGHPYATTRLPADAGDVYACTYKHSRDDVLKMVVDAGFRISSTMVISASGPTSVGHEMFTASLSDPVAWALAATVPARK
ncbi:methyltransferase domain-containing protein [Agrobacterium rubi]|nr:methyltransferase domain-containing protein [Agrobacterium rubi]NTF24292.1 methyltransferase domain-containing protein [Agrobacterium rubi]